ncbi:MAG TPA: hypothetical protein VLA12_18545 [Planctomycetaceae bacterium]|nr:hypothetical protein [Planctomycetaceae bacterium]
MNRTRNNLLALLVLACVAFWGTASDAQTRNRESKPELIITPEREAAARMFAQPHHPELIQLLDKLQQDMETRYGQAIRQLYQASERLARTKERSEQDYELQLSLWKVDSRIQLHAARLSVSRNSRADELKELETLLKERVLVRRKIYEREREKLQARVDRLDESLDRLSDVDRAVAQEMKAYQNLKPAQTRKPPEKNSRTTPKPQTKQ